MNPDVAGAIPELQRRGILSPEKARFLSRIYRLRLISVRRELRFLLYLGVLLLLAGVGVLVEENLEQIGPAVIAAVLGLLAAGCLAWVARTAPPFAWEQTESPHLAFDYILMLGVLLAASDLAYIEVQFTPLGKHWSWHLLWVSLFLGSMSIRYDSRLVFSLALSSFASWRGVSVSPADSGFLNPYDPTLRANAVACGLVFVLLGWALRRTGRKAHFEPVAVHLGWLLILGSLYAGVQSYEGRLAQAGAMVAVGAVLALYAHRRRRFWLFGMGTLAAYLGISFLVTDALLHGTTLEVLWYAATALAGLPILTRIHRRMQETP